MSTQKKGLTPGILFVMVMGFHLLPLASYAQSNVLGQRFSIQIKNQSVEEAFDLISKKTGYTLNYKYTFVERTFTKDYENERLETILRDVWGTGNIQITTSGKAIKIKKVSDTSNSEKGTVKGKVIDGANNPVPFASVFLKNTTYGTPTDENGDYVFAAPGGDYKIMAVIMGYGSIEKTVTITPGSTITVDFVVREKTIALDEVTILGKSKATELTETITSTVSVIETRPINTRSVTLTDLLRRTPGVQIRQSGGVGNASTISIQGLSGNQIKLFVNGVPMEFLLPIEDLGTGPTLATFPVNLTKRMEVYKGAVPVSMGAAALGGAINIVTNRENYNVLEVTTAHSSFNTWQSTLNARKVWPSGFMLGFSGGHTYSDNDYTLNDVVVANAFGNPESISAKKFHDAFKTFTLKGNMGFVDRPWADYTSLNFSYTDVFDEIQHNFQMRQPYGETFRELAALNTAFEYEKKDFVKNLDAKLYLGYNKMDIQFNDTSLNIYDWRGDVIGQRGSGGEITQPRSDIVFNMHNKVGRINLTYSFNKTTKLFFNSVTSFFKRTGENRFLSEGELDVRKLPVHINNLIGGLGIEKKWFDQSLVSHSAVKVYHYKASSHELAEDEINTVEQQNTFYGANQSFSWRISESFLGKLSYEYGTRLPGRLEFLGDLSNSIEGNPNLKPERSHNVNLGGQFKKENLTLEANAFFRHVKDIIWIWGAPPPVLSNYENLFKARVLGLEGELEAQPLPWLNLTLNATYQDLRDRSSKEASKISNDNFYGDRLPNRPFLFGNGQIQITDNDLVKTGDELQLWWIVQYVEEFFRFWEDEGRTEDKLTVPTQWINNLGLAYTTAHKKYALSLECQNLFDQNAYDNFRVQKPGRSFHIKLKVSLFNP